MLAELLAVNARLDTGSAGTHTRLDALDARLDTLTASVQRLQSRWAEHIQRHNQKR